MGAQPWASTQGCPGCPHRGIHMSVHSWMPTHGHPHVCPSGRAQGIWSKWGAILKIHSQANPFRTESWPLPPVLNSDCHSRANIKAGLWSSIESKLKSTVRMFLVIQWLRICLSMQETRAQSLVQEDSICCGATETVF